MDRDHRHLLDGCPAYAISRTILLALLFYIGVGINEEALMRGYRLRNLAEGLNLRRIDLRRTIMLACRLSSAIFGLLYIGDVCITTVSIVNLVFNRPVPGCVY